MVAAWLFAASVVVDGSAAIAAAKTHAKELSFHEAEARVAWDSAAAVWRVEVYSGLAWVSTGGGVVYRVGRPPLGRWSPDYSAKWGHDGRYQMSRELGRPRLQQVGGAPIVGASVALALQRAMLEVVPMSVEQTERHVIVVVAGRIFWGCGKLAVFIDRSTGRVVDERVTSFIDGGYAGDCAAFWEWRTPFDGSPPVILDL